MKDSFLKLMFNILKNYINFIIIYCYLQERMKLEKVKKLFANLHDKTKCVIHIRNLNPALIWVLSKNEKNNFEEGIFKLINNVAYGKTMENVRKHRNIRHVTTERRRNYLVSEPHYHTTNFGMII